MSNSEVSFLLIFDAIFIPAKIGFRIKFYFFRMMNLFFNRQRVLLILVLAFASCSTETDKKLPIIGLHDIEQHEVHGKKIVDTSYHKIPDFSFINQDSSIVTNETFDDKVYIANFFFTNCPSICPTMQRSLLRIYEKYSENKRVALLSHSIDFKHDSPSVLKSYAQKLGVKDNRWQFVTGSKKDIYGIAEKYLVYASEDASAPGGYDHQSYLVLVDQNKYIRGFYDGTNDEQVLQLLKDIETLMKENKHGTN